MAQVVRSGGNSAQRPRLGEPWKAPIHTKTRKQRKYDLKTQNYGMAKEEFHSPYKGVRMKWSNSMTIILTLMGIFPGIAYAAYVSNRDK